jgi:hypothetical protein
MLLKGLCHRIFSFKYKIKYAGIYSIFSVPHNIYSNVTFCRRYEAKNVRCTMCIVHVMKDLTPCSFSVGLVWIFSFMYVIQHYFICRPSDSTLSEDAGIEPRTFATLALTVRRFNHLPRSHQSNICTARGLYLFSLPSLHVIDV